jgi:hypothetical protein
VSHSPGGKAAASFPVSLLLGFSSRLVVASGPSVRWDTGLITGGQTRWTCGEAALGGLARWARHTPSAWPGTDVCVTGVSPGVAGAVSPPITGISCIPRAGAFWAGARAAGDLRRSLVSRGTVSRARDDADAACTNA